MAEWGEIVYTRWKKLSQIVAEIGKQILLVAVIAATGILQ